MRGLFSALLFLLPLICCAEGQKQETSKKTVKQAKKLTTVQKVPAPPLKDSSKTPTFPGMAVDSLKNIRVFNYNTEITPIQPKIGSLRDYAGQNLMVIYFSVHCGHCKQAMPHAMKLAKALDSLDIPTIAIATQSSKPDKIPPFIEKYHIDVPMFNDQKRAFSKKYGTGYVPLLLLLNKRGNFIQVRSFSHDKTPDLILAAFKNPSLFPE